MTTGTPGSAAGTKRRLRTGAHVRVIVTAVNPIEGLIDLDARADPVDGVDEDDGA